MNTSQMTRRSFLRLSGAVGAALVFGACGEAKAPKQEIDYEVPPYNGRRAIVTEGLSQIIKRGDYVTISFTAGSIKQVYEFDRNGGYIKVINPRIILKLLIPKDLLMVFLHLN